MTEAVAALAKGRTAPEAVRFDKETKMSWKPEVQVAGEKGWHQNALCFASKEEAEAYAHDLYSRWTSTTGHRAVESDDAVNYEWVQDHAEPLKPEAVK